MMYCYVFKLQNNKLWKKQTSVPTAFIVDLVCISLTIYFKPRHIYYSGRILCCILGNNPSIMLLLFLWLTVQVHVCVRVSNHPIFIGMFKILSKNPSTTTGILIWKMASCMSWIACHGEAKWTKPLHVQVKLSDEVFAEKKKLTKYISAFWHYNLQVV